MQITSARLREIIIEELILMENFLKPHRNDETIPLDDEVIKAILSATSKKSLNEQMLTEDMKERIRNLVDKMGGNADAIKRVAQRLGLATALVASIVGGGMTGAYLASGDSVSSGDEIELQVQDDDSAADELGFVDIFGSAFKGEQFSGMSNQDKIKAAWSQYDLSDAALVKAPVSSSVWIYKFKMVPANQFSGDTVLPLAGATAQDYYNALRDRVEANPMVELPLLKNLVYGNTGKWSGGVGGKSDFMMAEDGSQILPPDWTVAYTVYADLMEEKTLDLVDYHIDNPEDREQLYQSLGVEGESGFNKFVEDTMFKIGRPLERR